MRVLDGQLVQANSVWILSSKAVRTDASLARRTFLLLEGFADFMMVMSGSGFLRIRPRFHG